MAINKTEKNLVTSNLRSAIVYIERAHRLISPETHGDDYLPIVNQVEDALDKLREVERA